MTYIMISIQYKQNDMKMIINTSYLPLPNPMVLLHDEIPYILIQEYGNFSLEELILIDIIE